jgi:uncharacterized protein YuzE
MKMTYDEVTDSIYIRLSDRPRATAREVHDGVVLEYDENGRLVAIDVQHASALGHLHSMTA